MEIALKKYFDLFKSPLPLVAIEALMALFQLRSPRAKMLTEALIDYDGQQGLDHATVEGEAHRAAIAAAAPMCAWR